MASIAGGSVTAPPYDASWLELNEGAPAAKAGVCEVGNSARFTRGQFSASKPEFVPADRLAQRNAPQGHALFARHLSKLRYRISTKRSRSYMFQYIFAHKAKD